MRNSRATMPTLQRLTGFGSGACLPGPRPCLANDTPRNRTAKPYSIIITQESARKTTHDAASNTDRVYFLQGERRKVGSTWTNHYYTRDHLGSVREVLDTSGTLLARYDYAPYGERQTRYEASGYEGTDFGFTGHFLLPSPVPGQSEIILAHYRAYDPVLGRWLSQDPIREMGGINVYQYCHGDPMLYVDRDGRVPWVVTALIGGAIGGVVGFVTAPEGQRLEGALKGAGVGLVAGATGGLLVPSMGVVGAGVVAGGTSSVLSQAWSDCPEHLLTGPGLVKVGVSAALGAACGAAGGKVAEKASQSISGSAGYYLDSFLGAGSTISAEAASRGVDFATGLYDRAEEISEDYEDRLDHYTKPNP